jgi:fido (protein-threonine AMPylation protein)
MTRKKKQEIGTWKSRPNEIINYKGEKISFTQPEEVDEEMHKLLNTVNADLDAFFKGSKKAKHPLFIAADFHLNYVSIHPFFDGNGRTARIFTNLILISCGYPPIIIKDDEKEGYYQTLADIQAYNGSPDLFYRLMGKRLQNSLQLMLDAIEGKDIEEPDDIEKRLELLRQMTEEVDDSSIQLKKEDADLDKLIQKNVFPLMELIYKKYQKIESMFTENQFELVINAQRHIITDVEKLEEVLYKGDLNLTSDLSSLKAEIYHQYFKKAGVDAFHVSWELKIKFEKTRFELYLNRNAEAFFKKLYHQIITEEERKNLAENYLKSALDQIDQNLERLSR